MTPFSSTDAMTTARRTALLLLGSFFCLTTTAMGDDTDRTLERELGLVPPPATSQATSSRLDEWKALTAPGGTAYPVSRYAAFLHQQPAWPLQKRIESRYEKALLADASPQTRRTFCPAFPITQRALLSACSSFLPDLPARARQLWRETDMGPDETRLFLARFSSFLTADDDLKRYGKLESTGSLAAARQQLQRLPADMRPLLNARLANRFATPDADSAFWNSAGSNDAALTYYRLKYLRLHDRLDEAQQLWQQANITQTVIRPAPTSVQWQDERTSFVRALLRSNTPDAARISFDLLNTIPAGAHTPDSHLMAGYVALTLLHDPDQALPHFKALSTETDLNRQATGLYWMARTAEARHANDAMTLYKKAASLPTTFYGQLALAQTLRTPFLTSSTRDDRFLAALKQQLDRLPATSPGGRLPRPDLVDAATRLQQVGDMMNASLFLTFLQARTQGDKAAQPAIAQLALSMNLPKAAILASRQMMRQGSSLYPAGYPTLDVAIPSALPDGLMPALIRQESSMDEFAVSPRHALGLTQLLFPTAQETARRHQLPYRLTSPLNLLDPNINITIGSLFMADLYARFGNVLPYALAAYNAGPSRSQQWQTQMNSPASPTMADEETMLRWIMLIPYKETRFYIEHIETDMSLYALATKKAAH